MDAEHVTLGWTVEQVLERHPSAIRVFLDRRMACVGCTMAPFDTIADCAANYGTSAEGLLADLRSARAPDGPNRGPGTTPDRETPRDETRDKRSPS